MSTPFRSIMSEIYAPMLKKGGTMVRCKHGMTVNQDEPMCERCEIEAANACENPECDEETCQACCEHSELDHGVCMDCGSDRNEWIGAARYDSYKASRGG